MSRRLCVSLGINLALIAAAGFLLLRDGSSASDLSDKGTTTAVVKSSTGSPRPSPSIGPAAGPQAVHDVIARLEKAGVPRVVLADVVKLDFRRRWNRHIAELENRYAPRQPPQREYLLLQRQHDDEEVRELKEALGEDGYLAWDKEETMRKVNFEAVPLNPAETDQVYRFQKQLDDKLRELQMAMEDGDADISDMGTLQLQAQDAYEKELQNLLGQERYDQIKGYNVAKVGGFMMFNQLTLSDDQTKALQSAASQFETREAKLESQVREKPVDAATIAAQLQALNDARDEAFRTAVGADAYASLKRDNDDTYQTLTQYAGAWNLKDSEIEPVYEKIKAYVDGVDLLRRAAQIRELAGQTADWKAVNAAIDQSRQQTEAALQTMIGSDGLARVSRNGLLSPLGSERNAPHPPPGFAQTGG